ncbi:transient receptor potential cation channel subfamily A member 1-like [Littorina saxatilis]|uniref:transient receptor potential cation channel subfamily A member 1-like n=1 Tax=Littorina saxatilis TaxID=31220 RepID=UPI0038B44908
MFPSLETWEQGRLEEEIDKLIEEEVTDATRPASREKVVRPVSGRSRRATNRLFDEVATASKDEFEKLLNENARLDTIDPETKRNILLHVLHEGRRDLARLVLARANVTLICQDCDVAVATLKGKKNALHYVTELGDVELAKEILNKIPDQPQRIALLKQETPVKIEGQRPRTLSCSQLAAYLGNTELLVLYLGNGVHVNDKNSKKDTALLWAARWNHLNVVQELLSRDANANIENDKGSTALYWAVRYGHTDTVRLLITTGRADVNVTRKLGLVSPIILACALGYLPIVKLLLEGGADPNQNIRGKERPIHHAAREGYSEIIDYLLEKGARKNESDESGDTALLHAARHGHARCVQLLLAKGAKHTVKNHMGEDLMSLAVDSDNNLILKIVLQFVKSHGEVRGSRSPLLLAAASGQTDKIASLLTMGLDPAATDDEGNTMIHHAAIENQHQVITKFHDKVKVDLQNSQGNTALHEACARGHAENISALISSKSTASIRNNRGETPLHLGAYCKTIQPDMVKKLMDYVIKSHAWESLNIKDKEGNNALHIAAKFARPEVMWEFRHVPFKIKDADGNIALHEAVRPHEPEALSTMLDIYEAMKRDADINEQNNRGETVLHLAAKEGFHEQVQRLVLLGADLSAKDMDGNTVFHTLTQLSADHPERAKLYLKVFETVLNEATMWWCINHHRQYPHGDSAALAAYSRQASLLLLTETYNDRDSNVIAMACQVGASDIVNLILSKKGVMCHEDNGHMVYNVTNMTPLTNNSVTGCCRRGTVVPRPSYIEFLLSLEHPVAACKVLDVQPFREIEKAYSSVAAWTYIIIMVIHIIYMSLLSYSGITLLERRRVDPTNDTVDAPLVFLYVIAPIEPAIILLYDAYRLITVLSTGELPAAVRIKRVFKADVALSVLTVALPIVLGVIYSILVIVWILFHELGYSDMDHIFSVAVCIGWLYTISFTRGIRIIHYFWKMIQNMIVKDIFKFLFIYLFVLLAFAFAFHAVFQISSGVANTYPSPFDSAFLVFNLMIGMDELFTDDFETNMTAVGRSTVYTKVLYLVYMVLGTILLLNLLIAMMNDSYSSILNQHSVTWRIESVQLGVDIEKSFPWSTRMFSRIKFTKNKKNNKPKPYDRNTKRPSLHPDALAHGIELSSALSTGSAEKYRDVWSISVPEKRVRDINVAREESEREMLRDLQIKMASVEQRMSSDLQQVKHDLDDIRAMLREMHQLNVKAEKV